MSHQASTLTLCYSASTVKHLFRIDILNLSLSHIFPFILFFNTGEHLKRTSLLDSSIISCPVWGFLPLRFPLSFTQNLPKPLIRTSSPFSSVSFMTSKRESISRAQLLFGRSSLLWTESIRSILVRAISWCPLKAFTSPPAKTSSWTQEYEELPVMLLTRSHPATIHVNDVQ